MRECITTACRDGSERSGKLKHALRRVSLAVHTERDAAVQIAQLLHEQQCRIEHLVEPLTSLGFLAAHAGAQAPYGASAAPPGVALLRLNSSCPELRVGVMLLPTLSHACVHSVWQEAHEPQTAL